MCSPWRNKPPQMLQWRWAQNMRLDGEPFLGAERGLSVEARDALDEQDRRLGLGRYEPVQLGSGEVLPRWEVERRERIERDERSAEFENINWRTIDGSDDRF